MNCQPFAGGFWNRLPDLLETNRHLNYGLLLPLAEQLH